MKAMIFAAGLGTRLRPLTDTLPKALVNVNGIPLLEIILTRLQRCGFRKVMINVHHLAGRIVEFLDHKDNFGLDICISHEAEALLDTGGGLKKASWFFNDQRPFLTHNVDIVSDIDLRAMYQAHVRNQALATLAVTKRHSTRYLLFDQENTLYGWKNTQTEEVKIARSCGSKPILLAFSGVSVISPAIFAMMPERQVFSIIDVYLHAAATKKICAFHHDHALWADLGKKGHLAQASEILRKIHRKGKSK